LQKTFFTKKWKQRDSGCGNVADANSDKMFEVDPESCAQAFKGSSSVNQAPTVEDSASVQAPGALFGLKVIDLTRVLGGPYCTMVLSDHGAEVIKLEPPQGDETREWGPPFDDGGDASYFIGINRNKQSVGLDLSKPAGREVLLRLLEDADVLVENFKPGSMEKWVLGYEDVLSKRFPRLIHCRVSGFGADGPLGGFPGYDAILQAMVGLMSINGTETSGPTRLGNPDRRYRNRPFLGNRDLDGAA
jgi:crotonobetainyl-CoA:carnitine CoA-transferase CaiB-like acyl-CoA transferase